MFRASLAAAVLLAVTGPLFFFKDAGPGRPDDIAELLPEETLLFSEFVRAPRLLKDWKRYVGAFCTPEGKEKVCKEIEDRLAKALDVVPEKLLKDLQDGLPSLQRLAFAVLGGEGGFHWVVLAKSSDPAFLKRIVEEDLKVFAGEERAHQGFKVLSIRKLGEMKFPEPILMSVMGDRLAVTTDWPAMVDVLDRAAGKGHGGDLRQNAMYKKLAEPVGEDPVFRAATRMSFTGMTGGFGSSRRAMEHSFDTYDAFLGFRKIRGGTMEATFRPGKVTSDSRLYVDAPCALYDIFRQPAGPKETLRFVPAGAPLVVHVNLRGGREVWADIETMMKRAEEVLKRAGIRREEEGRFVDEIQRQMEQEIGVGPAGIVKAIGGEIAFAMVGENAFTGGPAALESLLFVIQAADPEEAAALIQKITSKVGPYETKKEGDATFYFPPREGELPVYALQGKIGLIGTKADRLREALKTAAEGAGFDKRLPVEAAKASKLFHVSNRAIWQLLAQAFQADMPDLSKDLDLNLGSTILLVEEKDHLRNISVDAGHGLVNHVGTWGVPLVLLGVRGGMGMGFTMAPPAAASKPEAVVEPAALPAEKLAGEVKKHLAGLRSDDAGARDEAGEALKALGRQAAPLLIAEVKKESDLEVKERLMKILMDWKAYDADPELLHAKVSAFVSEFEKALGAPDPNQYYGDYASWPRQEGMPFPHTLEPNYINTHFLTQLRNRDLLDSVAGLKGIAELLRDEKLAVAPRRQLAAVLAYAEVQSPPKSLLDAHAAAQDPETKAFLQIALGSCADARAKEALLSGLKDGDVWMRRASFIGVERMKDATAIPRLLELLNDADNETRWNASYTLRALSGEKAFVNVYSPAAEFDAACAAAREWWEKNKSTFKPAAR